MKKYLALVWFCLFLAFDPSQAQVTGTVMGIVTNEMGLPVDKALAVVDPLDGRTRGTLVRERETDKNGHFLIDNLGIGTYKVFAMKESEDYPNTSFAFYSRQVYTTATLTEGSRRVELSLRIGPPAGNINGLVTDGLTKQPVSASFRLLRASDAESWISLSQKPEYRVLVPPDDDILVEVSAPGYKTFYYGGPLDTLSRVPIKLAPKQEMKLNIQMQTAISADRP